MYAYVWDEKVVKALALLGVLAMVGMTVMPVAVGDAGIALAVYGYTNGDFSSLAGGVATTGGGIAALGAAITTIAGMETVSTLALVGIAVTGVGLGVVIG